MILDHLVVQGLLLFFSWLRNDGAPFSEDYAALALITFFLMSTIYNWVGVYRHDSVRNDYLSCLMRAWGTLVVVLALFGFVTKTSEDFSRQVMLSWSVTGFIAQVLVYYIIHRFLSRAISETIPSLMIGGGELGRHVAGHLNRNAWIPDQIVGMIEDNPDEIHQCEEAGFEVLGGFEDVQELVQRYGIRRVYISLPMSEAERIKPLTTDLIEASVDVIWAPDIFGLSLLNYSIKEVAGVPLISLSETPLVGAAALTKSAVDKLFATVAIILLSPLLLATALAVKLSSPGPIIYVQNRHGWDGRIVKIYKFRSMVVHDDAQVVKQATKDDDRITPIGRFIRRTSIDELPQLFNVLEGSMSLVGPRPHAVSHNEFYRGKINAYMLRHRIKPGLTGLAQVNGFRGETDTIDKMESRVNYDLAYINNWSIWLDLEIMIRTVFVLFGKNAY